jgi:FkbM family methyltransferase
MLRALQKAYHGLCPRLEVTKSLHGIRCRININDHLMWLIFPQSKTIEAGSHELMARLWGNVWDIGCNFGFYSMVAARAGNQVVAFDMSHHVLEMLERSCRLNRVTVTPVARAITPTPRLYAEPRTSACTNRCTPGSGESRSITYAEAAQRYGVPAFIKMDIEGGEKEFLENAAFCKWIGDNRITLLVETHHGYRPAAASFAGMTRHQVDEEHFLFEPLQSHGPSARRLGDGIAKTGE